MCPRESAKCGRWYLQNTRDAARARLAELEAGFTVEKAKIGTLKGRLFSRLHEHFQERDRLRLVVSYRRKYLEALVRSGEEDAEKVEQEYREADARNDREYSETAEAMAEKKDLAPEEAAELGRLWRKLVKLFHPDRFASDPIQQATYEKLTAAINHAKDNGDLGTLRRIAEDPQGFILRQGGRRWILPTQSSSRSCGGFGRVSSWRSSGCWRR